MKFILICMLCFFYATSVCGKEFLFEDGVQLTVNMQPFESGAHKIKYFDNGSSKPLIKSIDGVIPFGIAPLNMPSTEIKSISLEINKKIYSLNAEGMYNPGKSFDEKAGKYIYAFCSTENDCIARMVLSDSGETYVAEWVVRNGEAYRTVLTSEMDVVRMFVESYRTSITRRMNKGKKRVKIVLTLYGLPIWGQ